LSVDAPEELDYFDFDQLKINNLDSDLSDCIVYTILLNYVNPQLCPLAPLRENDKEKRYPALNSSKSFY